MIIKYYSASAPKYIVERDLSKEKITDWEITTRLGYKPKGSLIIEFDTSHIHIEHLTNQGGIYPPVSKIINYKEILEYLQENFSNLQKK